MRLAKDRTPGQRIMLLLWQVFWLLPLSIAVCLVVVCLFFATLGGREELDI